MTMLEGFVKECNEALFKRHIEYLKSEERRVLNSIRTVSVP